MKKILMLAGGCFIAILAGCFVILSGYDFSSQIRKATDQVYEKTGRHLEIKGETRLDISLSPRLVLGDISFENAGWSETPVMITAERFEIELDLLPLIIGKIVVKRAGLINSDLLIERNRHGVLNLDFTKGPGRPDETDTQPIEMPRFFLKNIFVENCRITYRNAEKESPVQVDIRHLLASGKSMDSPVTLDLQAGYGHFDLSAGGSVGSVSALLKKEIPYPFDLTVTAGDSDIHLTGSILDGLNDSTPKIKLDVDSKQLNPGSFISKEPDTPHGRVFSSDQISNTFLSAVDLDAQIRIHQLVLGKMILDEVRTSVLLSKGQLEVSPLACSVFNGKVTGSLHLTPVKENLSVQTVVDIRGLDTHVLCTQLQVDKAVKGLLDAGFRLGGTGGSLAAVMADLDGEVWLTMADGQIENGFLQSLGSDYFTNVLGFLNPPDEKAVSNQLNCAAARLECRRGIGTIKLLLADMPTMAAVGAGRIDFKKETLDISVFPTPKKGIDARKLGNINLSLGNLARAFKIGGTFASPQVVLDSTAAAKSLLKAAGGVVLLGPVGLIGALVGTDRAQKNPCPCALSYAPDGNDDNCDTEKSEIRGMEHSNPFKKILNIFDHGKETD